MRTVIIVNGKPRAGKDTAVAFMREILQAEDTPSKEFSSIDPVRDMLTRAGIDLSAKTPEDRALLATVGDAVERHSGFRTDACVKAIMSFFVGRLGVVFIHMREPTMIERLSSKIRLPVITVLIKSTRAENVTSNAADLGVHSMKYHAVISNNDTLDELKAGCAEFLYRNGLIEQKPLLP